MLKISNKGYCIGRNWFESLGLFSYFHLSIEIKTETYDGETRSESHKLVFGCFWIVSSWPSRSGNWICCGDGTGIRFASFVLL